MQDRVIELAGREDTASEVLQRFARALLRGRWYVVVDFSTLAPLEDQGCLEVSAQHGRGARYLTCAVETDEQLDAIVRNAQRTAQPVRLRAFATRPADAELIAWKPDDLFRSDIEGSESDGTVLVAKTVNDFTAVYVRYAHDVADAVDVS